MVLPASKWCSEKSKLGGLVIVLVALITACHSDSDRVPVTDMTPPDKAVADRNKADQGVADKSPSDINSIDLRPTDIRTGEPWYDLNCSFTRRCHKVVGASYPNTYNCFQDKQGKYNPCCPSHVGAMVWNGCKVGIDAFVVFSNGCAPPGWFHCEAGYMAPMDAGQGGR